MKTGETVWHFRYFHNDIQAKMCRLYPSQEGLYFGGIHHRVLCREVILREVYQSNVQSEDVVVVYMTFGSYIFSL